MVTPTNRSSFNTKSRSSLFLLHALLRNWNYFYDLDVLMQRANTCLSELFSPRARLRSRGWEKRFGTGLQLKKMRHRSPFREDYAWTFCIIVSKVLMFTGFIGQNVYCAYYVLLCLCSHTKESLKLLIHIQIFGYCVMDNPLKRDNNSVRRRGRMA